MKHGYGVKVSIGSISYACVNMSFMAKLLED